MMRYGLQEPTEKAFKLGEQVARSKAPVKTGFLRSSIRVERSPSSTKLVASAPYAEYVNRRVPFFTQGVEEIQRVLPGYVQQAVNEQAGRISRKYFEG
jgi:hypothetical protein